MNAPVFDGGKQVRKSIVCFDSFLFLTLLRKPSFRKTARYGL